MDKKRILEATVERVNKKYGPGAVQILGDQPIPQVEVVSTNAVTLDLALGIGGLPRGRITELYGQPASGKTSIALHVIANVQAAGGAAAIVDAEHALDLAYAAKLGVDVSNLLVSQPDCIEETELVATPDGPIEIKELPSFSVVGAMANGSVKGYDGIRSSAKVKSVFAVRTNLGELQASGDHRFLTPFGYRRLVDLKLGDHVAFAAGGKILTDNLNNIDYDTALMCGLLIGDGTYTQSTLKLVTDDNDICRWCENYLDHNFPDTRFVQGSRLEFRFSKRQRNTSALATFAKFFKPLLGEVCKDNKLIPKEIFQGSREAKRGLVAGLWLSDGHVAGQKAGLQFDNSSKKVAYGLSMLLWHLGIPHYIYRSEDKRKASYKEMWRVTVNSREGIGAFQEQIRLIGRKEAALRAIDSSAKESFVRFADSFWQDVKTEIRKSNMTLGQASMKIHAHNDIRHHFNDRRDISIEYMSRLQDVTTSGVLAAHLSSDVYWAKIMSIEVRGLKRCYDLAVPGPDNFVANNFVVHNSAEQALEIAETLVRSNVDCVVVDSVAALVPQAELEGSMADQQMGLQARLMGKALRKLTAPVHDTNCLFILINQVREKVGITFGNPEVTPGGRALPYYASIRIGLRAKALREDGVENGAEVTAKVVKNKLAPPHREAQFQVVYGQGIDRTHSLVEAAINSGVIQKSGSWYSYGDKGPWQGSTGLTGALKKDSKLAQEIEKAVWDARK